MFKDSYKQLLMISINITIPIYEQMNLFIYLAIKNTNVF